MKTMNTVKNLKITVSAKPTFEVRPVTYEATKEFILRKHYAQRMPSVSYSYGLFNEGRLEGVLTIGKPPSYTLCDGLLGKEHSGKVYELNRLVVNEGLPPNTLSWFVSRVLRLLNNVEIVLVSFADEGVGHHGYIYQATNFIYTGKTKERTERYSPGNKHSRHHDEDFLHLRKVRTPKHRYVWFSKATRNLLNELKYPQMPYPKGDNKRYVLGERVPTKILNRETGESYWE